MELHVIDIGIIVAYIASTIFIGFYISKKASKNINSYFLGGNVIPWYILGVSNASGMFDITGTMWLVYLTFVYGLKGIFIPWTWPVFNQIFLMIFLSKWLRRSNVMTGAEWLKTRFGVGKGAKLSHIIIVIFALVSVIGFLAYGFKGIGKFSAQFLPWELSANTYALIFMSITTLYIIKGGMYSVVLTELIQFVIMTIASIAIGIIAIHQVNPDVLHTLTPQGWENPFFGWDLNLDWSGILNSVNTKIKTDGYSLFMLFFGMVLFKGFLVSAAGPAPNYDMQRILATKSPADASKMSGMVNVALFFPRYMLIGGLAALAIVFFNKELNAMGGDIDFELILPYALQNFVPVGLLGLIMAGLLAAFMSTFAATVNAAVAYIVNDIYKRFINKNAPEKRYVYMSYICTLSVVAVGIGFGFIVDSIDSVTQWIVNALWGGYTAANLLKWFWWRFNGFGYFWGMVFGIIASLFVPLLKPFIIDIFGLNALQDVYLFPIILFISMAGSIIATLVTPPDNVEVLKDFYSKVRPWGFWEPIHKAVLKDDPNFKNDSNFKMDVINVIIGIVWQTSMILLALYLIIQDYYAVATAVLTLAVTSYILKKTWWDKLSEEKD
jgi:solute:Na+ symporter, SSS family